MAGGPSFADVANAAARDAERLCRRLLPDGHKDGHRWRCGDTNGNRGESLSVPLSGPKAGKWKDFATEESGDFIDLIKIQRGGTKLDAMMELARLLGMIL